MRSIEIEYDCRQCEGKLGVLCGCWAFNLWMDGGMLMFVHASSVLVAIPFMMLHRATVSTVFHSSC